MLYIIAGEGDWEGAFEAGGAGEGKGGKGGGTSSELLKGRRQALKKLKKKKKTGGYREGKEDVEVELRR